MKHNWTYQTIEACYPHIKNGANIKQIDGAAGIPITRIETLSGGVFNRNRMGYADIIDAEIYKDYILEDGDLLMSHINSKAYIGRTVEYKAKKEEQFIHGMNLLRLKGNNGSLLSSFFAYYTQSSKFKADIARIRKDAVNQSSFAISDLKKITIPVPNVDCQRVVIEELDQINFLIAIKEKQLRELEELEQTIFHEMFGDPVDNEKGWDVDKLGSVCDVRDGTHDSPKYLQQSNYMLITSKNISGGLIDFSNVNYISEEDYNSINKRSKVDDGDLIMPMVGTIGNPVIAKVDDSIHYAIKNVALIKFNQTSSLNNKFLHSLMNSYSFTNYMLSKNKGGTQKFVALGTIRSLPIIVPPLEMQNDYCEKAKLVESQKGKLIETLNGLQELLASRMQYWFD